ncbi:MAG: AMP-binding protein [Lentimicrobiaceae bacterium]
MPEISTYYNPSLTLPAILKRAVSSPVTKYIGYYNESGEGVMQSYPQLWSEASLVAIGLYNEGLKQGDKLIIATQSNSETLTLLWACFLSGIIPTVLQPPPTFTGYSPSLNKLIKVYERFGNPPVFMSSIPELNELPNIKISCISQLNCKGTLPDIEIDPNDIAFIQFSSGSTGDPKGIMLSHHNIIVNLDAIRIGLNINYPDVFGNWMPLFHDMGLIGYHLTPIYTGTNQWHIETIDFIKNPGLWLNMLSEQKVKITGCPNFGLALVLRFINRMKSKPQWDFSKLEGILNGAEPISVQIMNSFVEELKPFNLKPEAMMPVYGLAEASLAATFTPLMQPTVITAFDAISLDRDGIGIEVDSNHPHARLISSVGVPIHDIEISIIDHDGKPVPEGTSGLICLKGLSITSGYYNKPIETQKAFNDGWLSTGDIGLLYKGNYYISGRDKDIIFKNGRHYFANDLEELACTLEGISYGKICFAGITDPQNGHERIIAFQAGSPGEKAHALFMELRNLLRNALGITLDELIMVRSNEIPKTSSGKLQRYKLVQRYMAGEFDTIKILMNV